MTSEEESEQISTDLLDPLPAFTPLTSTELLALPSNEITLSTIETSFAPLSDTEVLTLSNQLISSAKIDNVPIIQFIVQLGQSRGESEYTRLEAELGSSVEKDDIKRIIGDDKNEEELIREYVYLEETKRRLDTWNIICPQPRNTPIPQGSSQHEKSTETDQVKDHVEKSDGMDLDDPWGEDEAEETNQETESSEKSPSALLDDPWGTCSEPATSPEVKSSKLIVEPSTPSETVHEELSLDFTIFLTQPILASALEFASTAALHALKIVVERHYREIYPFRYAILEAVPGWVSPTELEEHKLLPSLGEQDVEKWIQPSTEASALSTALATLYLPPSITLTPFKPEPLSSSELTKWYIDHILSLDLLGILDNQLAYVQHGASLGVLGLDEIGEDLSLLSRLVYDSNLSFEQHSKWTLTNWRKSTETEIIQAYTSNSTSESIVNDIRKLILPYLYVLESRSERNGKSVEGLVDKYLYDCILSLKSLEIALPIFENSKATLPLNERIIKNDLDVARLALSLLYSTEEKFKGIWNIMSSIFECLPVWELNGTDKKSDSELTSTTLDSIANFLRPSSISDQQPTSKDLFLFFNPLPFASLSRTLDILDVHLESGEILSRWNIETNLKFLLQSSRNKSDQIELAEKLIRKQQQQLTNSYTYTNEDTWRKLWDDMNRLSGTDSTNDNQNQDDSGLLKGALGMLNKQERAKIYLGGILRSGNFDIARKIIKRLQQSNLVDDDLVENVVLDSSKEFYLSAESGNLHTGDMKLAYGCLAVAPQTAAIQSEKSFIEATSKLTTFSSSSITPIEIRHISSVNPLKLIEKVLDSSKDSYKYPELMIELSNKLSKLNEVENHLVKLMIAKASFKHDDYLKTNELLDEIMLFYRNRQRKGKSRSINNQSKVSSISTSTSSSSSSKTIDNNLSKDEIQENQLKEELWKLSFDLSKTLEFSDIQSKIQLLSYSLELCPSSEIPIILETYQNLELSRIKLDKAAKRRRQTRKSSSSTNNNKGHKRITSIASDQSYASTIEEERVLGSRTAAKAAKIALDFSGKFGGLTRSYSPTIPNITGTGTNTTTEQGLGRNSPVLDHLPHLPFGLNLSRTTSRSKSPNPNPNPNPASTPRMVSNYLLSSRNGGGVGGGIEEDTRSDTGSETSTNRQGTRELFENFGTNVAHGINIDEAERVRQNAKRALVRGVGWLLGAEEGEITGGD
ncbi:uncharacterized protein L201_002420 [Kwoniella dendrophila CBS 6074]|uniref:Sec39 domain-containing protein n=1 Tax=Kwoniella dendrophila CBS 6074 TaxID=1295534 RepID=A0AAX4JSQ6_9TREE